MSILPHSLTTVACASCANAASATNGIEANAERAQGFVEVFMDPCCLQPTRHDARARE
jgi:hypothetical protein